MNNTFYFLRHGETVKDKDIPAIEWSISSEAKTELVKLASQAQFKTLDHIYSSFEKKAKESAEPFSKITGLGIEVVDGLEEVHRGNKYLSGEEFRKLKQSKLENRDASLDDGETSNEALLRFKRAIAEIDSSHRDAKILVASHGTVLALYFSDLKTDFENIFDYWRNLPFCAVGVVKNSKVIEDISNTR